MPDEQTPRIRPTRESPRGRFVGIVKENRQLCTDHYRLTLAMRAFRRSEPGQFVQLDCADPHAGEMHDDLPPRIFDWDPANPPQSQSTPLITDPDFIAPLAYLRRPFSLADHRVWRDEQSEIDIIHRVVGKGTLFLKQLEPGQKVSVIGPLGKGFTVPPTIQTACLVGGGVGIPPMLYLAKTLRLQHQLDDVIPFIGAQREDLLPINFTDLESSPTGDPLLNVEEFLEYNYPAIITTDDGSRGMKGYVTAALERFLEERLIQRGSLDNTIVYCCGPTPMMRATAKVAEKFHVPCQLSLEQPMACGMATCQSCVIKHRPRDSDPSADWKYKLTCTEGPVFDSRELVW